MTRAAISTGGTGESKGEGGDRHRERDTVQHGYTSMLLTILVNEPRAAMGLGQHDRGGH
jgi:hypothetical protein